MQKSDTIMGRIELVEVERKSSGQGGVISRHEKGNGGDRAKFLEATWEGLEE